MNAQPKITAATTQPHSLFPSFTGYGGSDLEVNLAYREEIRKLRKENEELKDENIALEAAFDAISGQNDQLLRILGDRVAFAAEILEDEAVESNFTPEQSATWRFLDEVGLTPEDISSLAEPFSPEEIDALNDARIKVFISPNSSKDQRRKAAELISATLTPQAQVAIFNKTMLAEPRFDIVSDEFDHTIFLDCGRIDFLSKSELGELKSNLRVISGQNLNVVNVLRKIAAHHIKKEKKAK